MRIVFCGSGSFAAPSLQAILNSDHELTGVVTQPPRRAGRGSKLRATLVDDIARAAELQLLETSNINSVESVEAIAKMRPQVICVVEFGQMIRSQVRDLAEFDSFNLHASVLPALRGAAPINWAIVRGHTSTGVTTFSLVDKIDAGDVYLVQRTAIAPDDTTETLRAKLAQIGAGLVCQTLKVIGEGRKPCPQNEQDATLAPLMKKADGRICWDQPAEVVRNLIHGMWPWPGGQAVYHHQGRCIPVTIASACVVDGECDRAPGQLAADLSVCTGSGRVKIDRLRPAGKRLMEWRDFVNGFRPQPGDSFGEVTDGR